MGFNSGFKGLILKTSQTNIIEDVSSYHNLSHYMKMHVFWDVTKRRLNCCRCFEGLLSFQLQGQAHVKSFEQWVTIYRLTRHNIPKKYGSEATQLRTSNSH